MGPKTQEYGSGVVLIGPGPSIMFLDKSEQLACGDAPNAKKSERMLYAKKYKMEKR